MVKEVSRLLSAHICFARFSPFVLLYGGVLLPATAFGFILLAAFMAYFFRDPRRLVPGEADIIVSAADGRVTRIEENENGKIVSVFLSPLDVHINRAPIAGRVTKIDYIRGKKNPATSDRASLINERNSLTIEGEKMTIVCTRLPESSRANRLLEQRRRQLELGEKFGLIKFSSRTDLLMPKTSRLTVKSG